MEDRRSDKYLTVSKYIQAHRRVWYAVLTLFVFLALAIIGLAYSLREESIARSEAIKIIADQNTELIRQSQELAKEGKEAHDALCLQRDNLQQEVDRTQKILNSTEGDIFGFPRALVLTGLRADQKHLDDLNENLADC